MLSIITPGNILLVLGDLSCVVCNTAQVVDMCFALCPSLITQVITPLCEQTQ